MGLEVVGEIRIFNKGYNNSRDMRGIVCSKVKHEPLEFIVLTHCYFAGFENSQKI